MKVNNLPSNITEVSDAMSLRDATGNRVDPRIFRRLREGNPLYEVMLDNKDVFLKLIFHEIDDCRLLTPEAQPRSLRDVVGRMQDKGWMFESMIGDLGFLQAQHNPKWFNTCLSIYRNFDTSLMSPSF